MTVFAITPSAGTALTQTHAVPMVQPGAMVAGNDGHYWLYVRNASSATIPPGTAVTVNDAAKTVTPGTGNFATGVVALPAGEFGWVRRVEDGAVPPGIGGVPIGATGAAGTIYEGYTLSWGDDFEELDIMSPINPKGRYVPTRVYHAGARGSDTALGRMYNTDPFHTGHLDSNRGVPVGYNNMRQAGSVLTIQARNATAAERVHFEGTARTNVSGMIAALPSFHFYPAAEGTGDIIIESRVRWTSAATNPAGWHPTLWSESATPANHPEADEHDIEGNSQRAYLRRNVETNGNVNSTPGGVVHEYDGEWHDVTLILSKSSVRAYVDGVLKQTGNYDANSKNKPQYWMLTNHIYNANFEGEGYSAAAWAADPDGATIEIDWLRCWRRTGRAHYKPLVSIPDANMGAGGSVTITLPSKADLWGDATVTDFVQAIRHEENEPGGSHSDAYTQFPAGVTYNETSRTLTVAPTDGKAGRLNFIVQAWKPDGATGEAARFCVNVGPVINFTGLNAKAGQSVNTDLYAMCDCGVLVTNGVTRAKTITVTGLVGSGLSYDDQTGMLTGTAVEGTYSLTITVTNSIGQTATSTRTIVVEPDVPAAPPAYAGWTGPGWFDASDDATVAVSGANVLSVANKRPGGDGLSKAGGSLTRVPSAQNGRSVLRFARDTANPARLTATQAEASPLSTLFQGDDKPFTVITVYRPTDANTGFVWSASDTVPPNDNQVIGLLRRSGSASSVRRNPTNAAAADVFWGTGQASGTARIVAVSCTGTTVTVWDNSQTKALNAAPQDVAAFNNELIFRIGATENVGSTDNNGNFMNVICAMDLCEIIIEGEAKADADIQQAITDLAAKWGIALS